MRQSLAFLLLACTVIFTGAFKQDANVLEGDLYYSFLKIGSFYGVPRAFADSVKGYLDTATIEHANNNRDIISQYAILKKENLLYSPFIYVKLNNDSVIVLYMNKKDYSNITRYRYKKLKAEHQKVHLRFSAKQLGPAMFACQLLIAADLTAGQTQQIQHKFKIEDYE